MIVVQGTSDPSSSLEARFGQLDDAHDFLINGWRVRIALDHSHLVDQPAASEIVIRDRPRREGATYDESLNGAFLILRAGPDVGLEIVLDRVGSIPVYYAIRGKQSCFSSRLLDLVRAGWHEPDSLGVLQWVCLGQPLGPQTPINGVRALPNAHRVSCIPGEEPVATRYWRIPRATDVDGRIEDYLDETITKLRQAHNRAAPPAGARLAMPVTGGLDSRCNLALWADQIEGATLFHTQDLGDFELPIARQIARELSKKLVVYDSADWLRAGPRMDLRQETGEFNAAHWRLVDTARRLADEHGTTATVDGFFQDFLFKASFVRDDSTEALIAQQLGNARYNARMLGLQAGQATLKGLESSIEATILSYGDCVWAASQDYYLDNRSRRLVYSIVRLNQNHLDVRTPGMDHDLMDFAFRLPKSLRKRSLLYRHVINALSPQLAAINYDKSGLPVLDLRTRSFKRRLFSPIKRNLNHFFPNRRWLRETETNFSQLFACDAAFRSRVASAVDRSRWIRDLFGARIIERLDAERRKGRPSDDLIGALVTLAALESQGAGND